ncbi:MAG: hypothetical protein K8R06_03695 [Methanosarcinales archaeon]|nr:hypothetical protein [Methanosarcinales archaeon]
MWSGCFYCGFQFHYDEQDPPWEDQKETRPGLFKPFAAHVLMHEYIHSPGYLDEQLVRQLAQDLTRFIPDLAYSDFDWRPKDFKMELVEGFDRGSVNYIN